MSNDSSSSEQIQIEFKPLKNIRFWAFILAISNDSSALFMLPEEILLKISGFASIKAIRNLIATCKYIRNQLNTWFLQVLASVNNPDRATSGFIIDAIGNKDNTCLWRNTNFFIKDHDIPKDLSIHLFVNTTAEKISSDEVRSMIIHSSGLPGPYDPYDPDDPSDSHQNIRKFLKFLFSKVSLKNLRCLMFCGVEVSMEFSQEMGALNLDVFHLKNFRYENRSFPRTFPLLEFPENAIHSASWCGGAAPLSTQRIEEACHILSQIKQGHDWWA